MLLSELVRDPFPDFGEDDEVREAESEGRAAMRAILEGVRTDPHTDPRLRQILDERMGS